MEGAAVGDIEVVTEGELVGVYEGCDDFALEGAAVGDIEVVTEGEVVGKFEDETLGASVMSFFLVVAPILYTRVWP